MQAVRSRANTMSSGSEIGQPPSQALKIDDVLRLEDVSCARRGRQVLDRVSLSVRAGDLVVVEGGRGAGKSTLLAVAAAALAPPRGAVYIGGRNVQALQRTSLPYVRRNIGYLAADPITDAIVLYVESLNQAREFMSAARAFSRDKPIVTCKAGRFADSAQAAASHTGAMAGVDAVYEAAFRRAGLE